MQADQLHAITPREEHIAFAADCPVRLRSRKSVLNEIPLPHYAATIEILLTEGVRGTVFIGSEQFAVNEERSAFFIAPAVVHFTKFLRGNGSIHVFKISLDLLKSYLDLPALLASHGCTLTDIPCHITDSYDTICRFLFREISYGQNNFAMLCGLVGMFEHLCLLARSTSLPKKLPTNAKILDIIAWTQARVGQRITVEEAAAHLHYSKYHFCRFFKEQVGTTYLHYVNTLKIDRAAKLLRAGHSATYCCFECGFESFPYFLKLFRQITGTTTSEYCKQLSSAEEGAEQIHK